MTPKKKILYCVLNWGLGHATRSEEIIRNLMQENDLVLASDGIAKVYLQKAFPDLEVLEMPSYNIQYAKSNWGTRIKLFFQSISRIPLLIKEKNWVKKVCKQKNIDLIYSDGRFACYQKYIPSIYITHQLNLKSGLAFGDKILSRLHGKIISKYTEIQIPDYEDDNLALAGELSRKPSFKTPPLKYIGPLSRFKNLVGKKGKYILFICSGPEPQRTLLEEGFWEVALGFEEVESIIVRGTNIPVQRNSYHIKSIDLSYGEELGELIANAQLVVCRSGYSSVMDLHVLGKEKVIWIPTPGQGEQEYLAEYLCKIKWGMNISQVEFWKQKLRKEIDLCLRSKII